jgi:hypothetical protein
MAVNGLELYLHLPSLPAQVYHGVTIFTNHLSSLGLLTLPKYVIELCPKQYVVPLSVLKICVIKYRLIITKMTLNTNIALYK